MNKLLAGRKFQLWEYKVSHGHLLVRSPSLTKQTRTVDIEFIGLKYVSCPRHLGEIAVKSATEHEVSDLKFILGDFEPIHQIFVLESASYRHLFVAVKMVIEENDLELFDSPWIDVMKK